MENQLPNSTPLKPELLEQAKNAPKASKRMYIIAGVVMFVIFALSIVAYKLTEPTANTPPPQVIVNPRKSTPKKPPAQESTSSETSTESGTTADPESELDSVDVGSVEGELQDIQTDLNQL